MTNLPQTTTEIETEERELLELYRQLPPGKQRLARIAARRIIDQLTEPMKAETDIEAIIRSSQAILDEIDAIRDQEGR